jgi:uncharacterized phage-associated protein
MANVFDVAVRILKECGEMPAMKLQKLVYYSQAWSLVWDEAPLFDETIEAWANGPVVRDLYTRHRLNYFANETQMDGGNPENLTTDQVETIDAVLRYYGKKSSQWLSDLTHMESPWMDAREGLEPGERGETEITQASIAEYYTALPPD